MLVGQCAYIHRPVDRQFRRMEGFSFKHILIARCLTEILYELNRHTERFETKAIYSMQWKPSINFKFDIYEHRCKFLTFNLVFVNKCQISNRHQRYHQTKTFHSLLHAV